MTKIRIHNPRNGKQLGINTDNIASWRTDYLVKVGTDERAEGFSLTIQAVDGNKITAYHDQGGQELLEILEVEFYPLNEKPVVAEAQP